MNDNCLENVSSVTVFNNHDLSTTNKHTSSPSSFIYPVSIPNLITTNSIARNLFSSKSPTKQLKKIEYDKTSQLYIVTKLTEMNTKINKVILDMSRHDELLKDILKTVKSQNKSIDDNDDDIDDDIFLKGFPIDNLESLREMNITLKDDRMFCKKLVKKLKGFHGSNIGKVTKSIMDVIFTNNLGRQLSITGKGPMNKKEKEPLKSSLLFKLVINAILHNDASISSANKAVSGWLKHSKERYERHITNDNQNENSQVS